MSESAMMEETSVNFKMNYIALICDLITRLSNGEDVVTMLARQLQHDSTLLQKKIGFICCSCAECQCSYRFETLQDIQRHAQDSRMVTSELLESVKSGHCSHYHHSDNNKKCISIQTSIQLVHLAAAFGDCELLGFLSDHGASLDDATPNVRMRPIHLCVIKNQELTLQYLLQASEYLNPCVSCKYPSDSHGDHHDCDCTPLMLAIMGGTDQMVDTLLGCKMVVMQEIKDNFVQRLDHLCLAVERETPSVLSKLLRWVGGAELTEDLEEDLLPSLLNCAVVKGRADMVRTILDYGTSSALYSYGNIFGNSSNPILSAVLGNNDEVLGLLLKYGAMASKVSIKLHEQKYSLLDIAKAFGFKNIADILIKAGVHESARISTCISPFSLVTCLDTVCSQAKQVELMEHLVKHGYRVDSADSRGNTALLIAVKRASLIGATSYRTLLKLGANPNTRNKMGESPYLNAIRHLNLDVVKEMIYLSNPHLEQSSADCKTALYLLTESYYYPNKRTEWVSRRQGILQLLLATGYDARLDDVSKLPFGTCDKEFREYLLSHLCTPTKLADLCRFCLRRPYTGRQIHGLVGAIDYPETLKEFLLMNDHFCV